MDINIALTLGGVMAILVGAALGYLLRWFIAMSKRGSVDIEVKQVLLSARRRHKRSLRKPTGEPKYTEESSTRKSVSNLSVSKKQRNASSKKKNFSTRDGWISTRRQHI